MACRTSLTRDRTCAPCSETQGLNYWTTREVPKAIFFSLTHFLFLNGEPEACMHVCVLSCSVVSDSL